VALGGTAVAEGAEVAVALGSAVAVSAGRVAVGVAGSPVGAGTVGDAAIWVMPTGRRVAVGGSVAADTGRQAASSTASTQNACLQKVGSIRGTATRLGGG
jgi:hypothetical protein